MICVLCHQPITLLDLDDDGYEGLPAHTFCAVGARAAMRDVLAECEALILAEPDPRRHRRGVSPAA